MNTLIVAAATKSDSGGFWAGVSRWVHDRVGTFSGSVVVAIIVGFAALGLLVVIATKDGRLALRFGALLFGTGFMFMHLVAGGPVNWSNVAMWATVAIVAIEVPKLLSSFELEDAAFLGLFALAFAFGLPIAVKLTQGTFSSDAPWFNGVIMGGCLSITMLGFRSVRDLARTVTGTQGDAERPPLRNVA